MRVNVPEDVDLLTISKNGLRVPDFYYCQADCVLLTISGSSVKKQNKQDMSTIFM